MFLISEIRSEGCSFLAWTIDLSAGSDVLGHSIKSKFLIISVVSFTDSLEWNIMTSESHVLCVWDTWGNNPTPSSHADVDKIGNKAQWNNMNKIYIGGFHEKSTEYAWGSDLRIWGQTLSLTKSFPRKDESFKMKRMTWSTALNSLKEVKWDYCLITVNIQKTTRLIDWWICSTVVESARLSSSMSYQLPSFFIDEKLVNFAWDSLNLQSCLREFRWRPVYGVVKCRWRPHLSLIIFFSLFHLFHLLLLPHSLLWFFTASLTLAAIGFFCQRAIGVARKKNEHNFSAFVRNMLKLDVYR